MTTDLRSIRRHQSRVRQCTLCPGMSGPPVTGRPVFSPVMLVGQAPGEREIQAERPFAWTAGKTLFGWFAGIGLEEASFRNHVYMSAVCRCYPGKNPRGGDRVPDQREIDNCSRWLRAELRMLQPALVIPAGKLAIRQFMAIERLHDVVGEQHRITLHDHRFDLIPLPHPSGASTWHRMEPGKSLLRRALQRIQRHRAWKQVCTAAREGDRES